MEIIVSTAGEQMLSELVSQIYEMIPGIDPEQLRNNFSNVFAKYYVTRIEEDTTEIDVVEKAEMLLL